MTSEPAPEEPMVTAIILRCPECRARARTRRRRRTIPVPASCDKCRMVVPPGIEPPIWRQALPPL